MWSEVPVLVALDVACLLVGVVSGGVVSVVVSVVGICVTSAVVVIGDVEVVVVTTPLATSGGCDCREISGDTDVEFDVDSDVNSDIEFDAGSSVILPKPVSFWGGRAGDPRENGK